MTVKRSDVNWIFRSYLGRGAESEETIDAHLKMASGDVHKLKGNVFKSPESRKRSYLGSSGWSFCKISGQIDQKKILVIGNCQAPNIARHISVASNNFSVLGVEVMQYHKRPDSFMTMCDEADIILSASLSESFGEMHTTRLKERYGTGKKIITYSSIYFSGEHPDIVYWGGPGERIASPMGDYHSKIVLRSFLKGLSEASCRDRYTDKVFSELGYYDAAAQSFHEWARREELVDIKILNEAQKIWRKESLMLTINHPRSRLLRAISDKFLSQVGVDTADYDTDLVHNSLVNGPIWPVSQLISAHHKFEKKSPPLYWRGGTAMDHDEFIWRSYRIYEGHGHKHLIASARADQINAVMD